MPRPSDSQDVPGRLENYHQAYDESWARLRSRLYCQLPQWLDPHSWRMQSSSRRHEVPNWLAPYCSRYEHAGWEIAK